VKLLLADDHPLFLDGLRNLLTAHGFEVVGTARDGVSAIEQAQDLRPDVILMDIQMPRLDGLAALRQIKARLPAIRIVMLTMSADDEHLFDAIREGASGYLLKSQDTDEFLALLAEVARGEVALSPGLATRILGEFGRQPALPLAAETQPTPSLSKREIEVLRLVSQGLTYKEVGAKLFITERTIKYHMGEIVRRLHLRNRAQVIEYALRSGLTGRSA